jgi:hypothetical protein
MGIAIDIDRLEDLILKSKYGTIKDFFTVENGLFVVGNYYKIKKGSRELKSKHIVRIAEMLGVDASAFSDLSTLSEPKETYYLKNEVAMLKDLVHQKDETINLLKDKLAIYAKNDKVQSSGNE